MQTESEGSSSWIAPVAGVGLALVLLAFVSISVLSKVSSAEARLLTPEPENKPKAINVAAVSQQMYGPLRRSAIRTSTLFSLR